jgi:Zn-dependent M16 (insulinase) family peptidase
MRRALKAWLHGGKPWDSLLFMPAFTELKNRLALNDRYFESLITKYLLNNPHRALVSIDPKQGFAEERDAKLRTKLVKKAASMTISEIEALKKRNKQLEEIQSRPDRAEALATVPHLSRKDLDNDAGTIPRRFADLGGVPALTHELFTNGITYVDLAFPVDIFSGEDYLWLPLFCRVIVSLGLPDMDYGAVSTLLSRTVGGFYGVLSSGSILKGAAHTVSLPSGTLSIRGRDWIIFRLKTLDEKLEASLDLARRIIIGADFSDQRRIRDLTLEMKNDGDASLAPDGHTYAASRSGRYFSRSRGVDELWNGLEQLKFCHNLANLDTGEVCEKLRTMRDTLLKGAGLLVNMAGSAEALCAAEKGVAARFREFGPPKESTIKNMRFTEEKEKIPKAEVFSSASLQVGFASLALPGLDFADDKAGPESVLAHNLSTGALWEDIRMKGGAYGASAWPDGVDRIFTFSTYRDPDPLRSIEHYPKILEQAAKAGNDKSRLSDENIEKLVIGTYSKEKRPRTSAEKSVVDFNRFLTGIGDKHRSKRLASIINAQAKAVCGEAVRLAKAAANREGPGYPVIIAGPEAAEKAAKKFGVEALRLPI